MSNCDLSLIVPMFNESARLESCLLQIFKFMKTFKPSNEIILVDDGSQDSTVVRAEKLIQEFRGLDIQIVRLHPNQGKGAAVRAGVRHSRGRVVMFADADNATPIEEVDRLLPLVDSPKSIVIGSRAIDRSRIEQRQPWWRDRLGRLFNGFIRLLLPLPYQDTQCGFKLFAREAANICFQQQTINGFAFDVELLWIAKLNNLTVREESVRWRHVEESRVHPLKHGLQMIFEAVRVRLSHRAP